MDRVNASDQRGQERFALNQANLRYMGFILMALLFFSITSTTHWIASEPLEASIKPDAPSPYKVAVVVKK